MDYVSCDMKYIIDIEICRSEEHTSELQSQPNLVCRLLLEKKHKQPFQNIENLNLDHELPRRNRLHLHRGTRDTDKIHPSLNLWSHCSPDISRRVSLPNTID